MKCVVNKASRQRMTPPPPPHAHLISVVNSEVWYSYPLHCFSFDQPKGKAGGGLHSLVWFRVLCSGPGNGAVFKHLSSTRKDDLFHFFTIVVGKSTH